MRPAAPPTRRELLAGKTASPREVHISSLVVHIRPEQATAALTALEAMRGVEIHATASGKTVVTLETESEAEIVTRLNEISLLEGVMSAALVFHHVEAVADPEAPAHRE